MSDLWLYPLDAWDREVLIRSQDGKCAVCGRSEALVVDHCHATGFVRGALCGLCNRGLGLFKDSGDRLLAAYGYLAAHRRKVVDQDLILAHREFSERRAI